MIYNERKLLDSLIQPTFTYLGRCEKLPDRRPNGSKLVNGDVFTLDTKEKRGKDTITISNEYVYVDNEWIDLSDIPQLNNEITDDMSESHDISMICGESSGIPVEMVKPRDNDFAYRVCDENKELIYEKDCLDDKIIDELCKVDGID